MRCGLRCGWHLDHGSLTGLTAAQYSDASGREVPCPDAAAGLYIRARDGEVVRATFRADQLAFQMGQATQIHSGGLLRATPHCVRAAGGAAAAGVARAAFAVFMQPQWDAPMDAPPSADASALGVAQWRAGMDFGEFAHAMLASYH
jgi:isopenicillin N synthase-like dioxygenase